MTLQDKVIVGAVVGIMAASIAIRQFFQNEIIPLAGLAAICAIAAADCFVSLRAGDLPRRVARRRFFMGLGAVIMFFVLLYLITKQLLCL